MEVLDLNVTYFEEGDYVLVINTSKVKMFFRTTADLILPGKYDPNGALFKYSSWMGLALVAIITVLI